MFEQKKMRYANILNYLYNNFNKFLISTSIHFYPIQITKWSDNYGAIIVIDFMCLDFEHTCQLYS